MVMSAMINRLKLSLTQVSEFKRGANRGIAFYGMR
jgi:hypothetical protein